MEKESEGNVYTKIKNIFINHPHATISIITLFAFVAIGIVIYCAPQFGTGQSATPTTNSLKFDLPSGSPQEQGSVEGASTQSNGPQEQQPVSQNSVSETPPSTASDSAIPTQTPAPTSSPTSVPTATPGPTSSPTETPTPTLMPTPTATPTAITPAPTE
jgi:hypothetical protein